MTNEKRKILNGTLRYVFLIIMALFVLVPVLWMVSTAFKTEAETYSPTPIWIPSEISLASFKKFFGIYNFGSMTMNSLVTCLGSMIICTVFSCLAGYGVTRFNFKGKKSFLGFLLVTQMFPSVMLVVPFYSMLTKYHMTNTLFGLIIVYAATNIAFSTWMMTSYFKTIPTELEDHSSAGSSGNCCSCDFRIDQWMERVYVFFRFDFKRCIKNTYSRNRVLEYTEPGTLE